MKALTFILIMAFLVLMDIGTTSIFLQSHSVEHEYNPIIGYFVVIGGVYGIPLAMLFKSILSGFFFPLLAFMPGWMKRRYEGHEGKTQSRMVLYAEYCQLFVISCYIAAAINNVYVMIIH
jgi:hypothetical protein